MRSPCEILGGENNQRLLLVFLFSPHSWLVSFYILLRIIASRISLYSDRNLLPALKIAGYAAVHALKPKFQD